MGFYPCGIAHDYLYQRTIRLKRLAWLEFFCFHSPANSAPKFPNNETEIRVQVGIDGSIDVTATDDDEGDFVNVTLDTSASWLRLNGTLLTWTNATDSSVQVNATLEATDSKSLTTSRDVKIQMCDCKVRIPLVIRRKFWRLRI